jgi:CD109 antigen
MLVKCNGSKCHPIASPQSNLGTVSLDYQLSDQPVFGDWTIRVEAQGMVEEATYTVIEYYQTRFEVRLEITF